MKTIYSNLLKEGEILLDNNHKATEINGVVVEMKYCVRCKEWHPISEFYKNSSSKDGLQSWCKTCFKAEDKRRHDTKTKADNNIAIVPTQTDETPDYISDMESLLTDIRKRDKEQRDEIARLRAETVKLKSETVRLDSLTERDIETVLKSNQIAPRLLFQAIARQDGRYTFFAKDNVSGQSYPIKLDDKAA